VRVTIAPNELEQIGRGGQAAYPNEGCGLLLGRWNGAEERIIEEVRPMENARLDSPRNRYLIRPEELLRISREVEPRGLEVVGFYHSHPDFNAVPSAFDREHAWPGYGYLIVRVQDGEPRETRAWSLREDREEFVEAELAILDGSPGETLPTRGAT
jgi:proteasome lid subunit RPN8/RPN11